jgi:hypothetical protein
MVQSRTWGSNLAKISLSGLHASPTVSAAICARLFWPGFSEQADDVFASSPCLSVLERLLLWRGRGGIAATEEIRRERFDVRWHSRKRNQNKSLLMVSEAPPRRGYSQRVWRMAEMCHTSFFPPLKSEMCQTLLLGFGTLFVHAQFSKCVVQGKKYYYSLHFWVCF